MLAKKDHSKAQKKSTSIAGRMKRFFLGAFKSKAKVSDAAESPLPCEETLRKEDCLRHLLSAQAHSPCRPRKRQT
ncbi:hypothetical protein NERG_01899 [Nematocida ausubeli]|uniref:Uncharacterized protein n=1 Tax=Nematocida ausubeli (strain ATCC PRA-371 / ERTm2) TaxID=1913371 RepID=H8ZE78_NEMA1|nr:hypothetical protein NERG_01899 [Nematocida ausubeli]